MIPQDEAALAGDPVAWRAALTILDEKRERKRERAAARANANWAVREATRRAKLA